MKQGLLKGSRSRILAAVILAIAAIFVVRLFYLQVIQHEHYVGKAKAEQESRFIIPAKRGEIYAMSGERQVKLVMNQTVYTVFADPMTVTKKSEIIQTLNDVAGGNVREGFAQLLDAKNRYQVLATKLSRVQADKIKEKGYNGIGFQEVSQRVYPEGALASQVLGFVNNEGKGTYGVESALDTELHGTDGVLQSVTDVSNVPLTIGNNNIREPAQDGKDVVLSIDRSVQSKVEQALAAGMQRTKATHASAVVMDPKTGRVMAMANLPTYNPSEIDKVVDVADFNNNVISDPYEPGSTIKTFTMSTAIDKNVARATDTFNNTDFIQVGDAPISNATKGKTGVITFQTAMNWSLNTGFVTIAQRLGDGKNITRSARDTMYEYFHDRFRMGAKTGVELANEAPGLVISPAELEGSEVRYSNMSFGQGMDATMIQVAAGFSSMVNGGNYYKPTVISGYMTSEGYEANTAPEPVATGVIAPGTADQIKAMMNEARRSSFASVDKPGYVIGGKTGTSQVSKNGVYSNNQSIGSYIGYGGSDTPEYVIMVRVSGENQELQGARDALPIFTDISNWMIDYLKIQPKG